MKGEEGKVFLAGFLLFVVVIFLNYMFYAKPLMQEKALLKRQIEKTEQEKKKMLALLKNFEALKTQRDNLKERIEKLKKYLPRTEDLPGLIRSIAQLAHYSGVDLDRVEMGKEVIYPDKYYAAVNIKVSFKSTYDQLVTFLKRVDNLERLVRPYKLNVSASGVSDDPLLKVSGILQTYRYVEPTQPKKKGKRR
ncbi:type IV pilus assembly protein PilO [Thermosulfidibacter takaii ABI70S6]|uniref:Type IV pilus assembly protein PilO n=1 Tax=Thermosulfidibacter takaii (strain DSM 17441 / JCM 13301 / NBRC 103674 / ABI70S6) TaxID=1298851 RepID=A0A0S3QRJ3_THET7|nr:type 4a pilus biogenesis protein PilO [Thermosulfidibacter takaii]BAT70951.1 type IV pilus assembly protein PilO [Thermosulfidibacter takaii ABI70S6]